MFKRVAINNHHWPDTRRLLCGTTAADEAKAVPVILQLSCPLVASEACHWSPDCDVACWRENVPQGQSTKTQVIEDFRIDNWPKRIQYCNLMSQNPITVQKNAERQVEVQSRLKEKKQLVSDWQRKMRNLFMRLESPRIHIVVTTLMSSSPCYLLNLVPVDVHFSIHSVRGQHKIFQYGGIRSVFPTENRLVINKSIVFRFHRLIQGRVLGVVMFFFFYLYIYFLPFGFSLL